MSNSFAQRIRSIEAKMNRLKTFGLSSSSSIVTTSRSVTIPFTIVPYEVNYKWDNSGGEFSARITVNWIGDQGLCSAYIKSPANLQCRRIALDRLTNTSFGSDFGLNIVWGSTEDLEHFNNGGGAISMTLEVEIIATAAFELSYTLTREHEWPF